MRAGIDKLWANCRCKVVAAAVVAANVVVVVAAGRAVAAVPDALRNVHSSTLSMLFLEGGREREDVRF